MQTPQDYLGSDQILRVKIARLREALQIALNQIGDYQDGDGAVKFHVVNIGRNALEITRNDA